MRNQTIGLRKLYVPPNYKRVGFVYLAASSRTVELDWKERMCLVMILIMNSGFLSSKWFLVVSSRRPALAETYLSLKRELEEVIQKKLLDPKLDIQYCSEILSAVRMLVSEDHCEGRFVFGWQVLAPLKKETNEMLVGKSPKKAAGVGGDNSKNLLQTFLARAGHEPPTYNTKVTKQLKNNQFCSTVIFNGFNFVGHPCSNKKLAEKDAAEAVLWLNGETHSSHEDIDHVSMLLRKSKTKNKRASFSGAKWS
ncbi:putative ATP-dependent RNA helicase [Quillaja saponaria]|uniref:ATP-dependent RNA helicase n=1 Tax=Quillaja saponaria TaxID=32244 RepID=A0AAD7Q5C8_QUISA|nr:putative ATP-dependent RNA helicase [Quillaja saponaria]